MITLRKGQEIEYMYCTPMDYLTSIPTWVYFKFVHRMTGEVVEFWTDALGESLTNRYAKYPIDTSFYFADSTEGMWTYTLQQAPEEEVVPTIGQYPILESGYLYLYPADTFEPTKYEGQDNTFIAYDGQ
jgi:hypothetical protein